MSIVLWILQVLLALVFGAAGVAKLTQPKDKLGERMKYVEDFSAQTVKAIGAVEVLAAIGLVVPWLTGIIPVLTPLAALGLVLTMIGAMITHLRRHETVIPNVVLLLLAAFVAWGRFTNA